MKRSYFLTILAMIVGTAIAQVVLLSILVCNFWVGIRPSEGAQSRTDSPGSRAP